ncbi:MAG TPA: hypothetical protein PKN71_01780 [Bacillota bacterium]|nr:hypothetical protein [Bacillota bacterium]HOC06026.1 hypothetical protein [Bacillota bacterium]HPZ21527.1 hypothetical protein [Bacillota bacterium]HQD19606.1 hypothetical protein [Bacillota bacterium]
MTILDKIECFLIKIFLLLAILLVIFQLLGKLSPWSDVVILLNRLEGAVYNYSGL